VTPPVPDNVVGAFSEEQAEQLSGVSLYQLRRWDKEGLLSPSLMRLKNTPYGRVYSFRDIVQLRVLNDLRNRKKIPHRHLREVSEKLAHLGEERWIATTLYVLGKRVVYDDPRTSLRQEVVSGQRVFTIPLRVVVSNARRAVRELSRREEKAGKIERGRFVSQNEPVIAGTRVFVATVGDYIRAGFSPAAIIREFPDLTEADIGAAAAYRPEGLAA